MRQISVSTEAFAAIWSRREDGEESEDVILRRLLGCSSPTTVANNQSPLVSNGSGGLVDARNGVVFSEGFRIFRHYKGREFEAEARQGSWYRFDNGHRYASLNQLNGSIAAGAENVWNGNWKFRDSGGRIRSIGDLRK